MSTHQSTGHLPPLESFPTRNNFRFGKKSEKALKNVHPYIVYILRLALRLSDVDFSVSEGLRSLTRQKNLVRKGYSKTLNSYHLYGLAVDVVPYVRGISPWDLSDDRITLGYSNISIAIKEAMEIADMEILENGYEMWGWDYPHWQMTKTKYNGYNPRKFYKLYKYKGF